MEARAPAADTLPSDLRRGRRLLRLGLVQTMRSTNVRADAIVFNSALSAYARNRLTLWKPARQLPCVCSAKRHARCSWCRRCTQPTCAPTRSCSFGAECVRAQPAAAVKARALAAARHARAAPSDTRDVAGAQEAVDEDEDDDL